MKLISKKKAIYSVNDRFKEYLNDFDRYVKLPIEYEDLLRYDESISYYDNSGEDTLWLTVFYYGSDQKRINDALIETYAIIRSDGNTSVMEHLIVDRVDLCSYGNTRPFRVRILNTLNENFDYFYVKKADASRVYGLELEHLLSPNRITFFVYNDTLIEEHISGIPGDKFIKHYLKDRHLDGVRLAKEFVKFNERCFLRLLGDMHSSNYVVDITPDFEETIYRIRSIDFDQQSYEGKKKVYLPQYFKENNPIIFLGIKMMTPETVLQYQHEERSLIHKRILSAKDQLDYLLHVMAEDRIAPTENVRELSDELNMHYKTDRFNSCLSMGDVVRESLNTLNNYEYVSTFAL